MKQDLTDTELDELADLLDATPAPLEALDVLMLDGFLVGVLVQPRLVAESEWLPRVFDLEGRALPEGVDAAWLARSRALIERRRAALNVALSEDGWFDPLVADIERLPPRSEYESQSDVSRALMPWAAGFHWAQECFADLVDLGDDAVDAALARLYRHLPAETDEERAVVATLEREHPLADLDAGIEDLVNACVELWDLTTKARFAVATVRRDGPKVGRNDPCPCGSGRKFKACHGKA
ncbi:MAG TPA: UPF0149 family protein [Burkholderiaceae bacterium]|nr:UPF0149 family protein [Burkholderiaceae bacterium]